MNAISPKVRLRQEFQKELHGYYQMHGEKNGSPIEGTIFPPDIKDKNEVALEKRVEDLSTFLADKGGMTYRPHQISARVAFKTEPKSRPPPRGGSKRAVKPP